jgi:hypothetical protein
MSDEVFAFANESSPLGYMIRVREALSVLFAHKIRDSHFQLFLFKWAGVLVAIVGVEVCGFKLMPMYLAAGLVAPCVGLFLFSLWLSAGDIFLKFAFEDEGFYLLALESRALDVFEVTELSIIDDAKKNYDLRREK